MLEAVGEVFPDAKYQRCTVHFYRNVFSVVPKSKTKIVAKMLKAIHARGEQKGVPGEGESRGCRAARHETEGGCQEGRGWH